MPNKTLPQPCAKHPPALGSTLVHKLGLTYDMKQRNQVGTTLAAQRWYPMLLQCMSKLGLNECHETMKSSWHNIGGPMLVSNAVTMHVQAWSMTTLLLNSRWFKLVKVCWTNQNSTISLLLEAVGSSMYLRWTNPFYHGSTIERAVGSIVELRWNNAISNRIYH